MNKQNGNVDYLLQHSVYRGQRCACHMGQGRQIGECLSTVGLLKRNKNKTRFGRDIA